MSTKPATTDNVKPANDTAKPDTANVKPATTDTTKPANDTAKSDNVSTFDYMFNQATLDMLLLFLAVYFIIVLFLAVFFRDKLASLSIFTGQVVDILVFGTMIYYAVVRFNKEDILTTLKTEIKRELDDFGTVIYLSFILLGLYVFSYVFKLITMSSDAPASITFLSAIGWLYMIILIIVNVLTHIFKIPVVEKIAEFINADVATLDKKADKPKEVVKNDEVFNVSNNLYTYDDAQNVCSTYGARLATYDEIEEAYNKGAEWCNYGWSEGQMAFFPTQKDTWSALQKSKKNANSCGRPGVNGGYMANPNVKFGVNCFGKKPEPRPTELMRMQQSSTPNGEGQSEIDAKVKYWKDNMDSMLTVSSYNKQKWSAY